MGREIKFRVWHTIEKNMYSVKALEFYGDDMTVGTVKFTLSESMSIYYGKVMQFTGRKDANGKEIYEGDIMRHREFSTNVVVEWNDGGYWQLSGWDFMRTDPSQGEVIGNIHEPPKP